MQTCKQIQFFLITILITAAGIPAVPALDFPSMPSVSSPSMPELGGSPYRPGGITGNTGNGTSTENSGTESSTGSTTPAVQSAGTSGSTSGSASVPTTVAGLALTAQNISGLGGLSALQNLGNLTGSGDLSSVLSSLSGLSAGTGVPAADSLSALTQQLSSSGSNGTGDTALLTLILEQLQQLNDARATPAEGAGTAASGSATLSAGSGATTQLLRFKVNGADIGKTCSVIYVSEPEATGAFLFTGDRIFSAGGKQFAETFYFLFKPVRQESGIIYYNVESSIMQPETASGSLLYPLTASPGMTARRTGNLVTLTHSGDGWNLDILLDMQQS